MTENETICGFSGGSNDWSWAGIIGLIAVAAIFGNSKPVLDKSKKLKYMIKLTDEQKQECLKCVENMQEKTKNSLEKYKENSVLSGESNTEVMQEYVTRQEEAIKTYGELIQKIKSGEELDDKTWNYLLMMLTIFNTYDD